MIRNKFTGRAAVLILSWLAVESWAIFVVTAGTFQPWLKIATTSKALYFEAQLEAIQRLRLDVPLETLGAECIDHDGKCLGYFGISPALMRMPFTAIGMHGALLNFLMFIAAFNLVLVAAVLLLRQTLRLNQHRALTGTGVESLLVITIGLTGPLPFLLAIPEMYFEAILWSVALFLSACYSFVRIQQADSREWWAAFAVSVVLASITRPTAALGVGLLCMIGVRNFWPAQGRPRSSRSGLAFALLLMAILSLNVAINYAKFGQIGVPLDMITGLPPVQAAILKEHGNLWLGYFPTHLLNALAPLPQLQFNWRGLSDPFDFSLAPGVGMLPLVWPATASQVAVEWTTSLGISAPILAAGAVAAVPFAVYGHVRRWPEASLLIPPIAASIAFVVPVLGFYGFAYRYHAEFVPLASLGVILAGARWLRARPSRYIKFFIQFLAWGLVGLGALVQLGLTMRYQRTYLVHVFSTEYIESAKMGLLGPTRYYASNFLRAVAGHLR